MVAVALPVAGLSPLRSSSPRTHLADFQKYRCGTDRMRTAAVDGLDVLALL